MKDFTEILEERIIYKNESFFIIEDAFPVSPGHLLIISNIVRENFFELSMREKNELTSTIEIAKELIEKGHKPDGYNIGMNCGEVAGQTIFHCHIHLIPRRKGDVKEPRGGVRNVIPGKGDY